MTKLFCALLLWVACAAGQTVEGRVVNSATGAGIPDVRVDISRNGKTVYALTTDARGQFRVEGVKDGSYQLNCMSLDYWPGGPESLGRFAIQKFQVSSVGNPASLEVRMLPAPTLQGRVVDGRGEGVRRARVQLTVSGWQESIGTDPDGTFYAHDLRPGYYTVSVSPPVGLKPPDPEPDGGRALGWARTFYPDVAIPDAAAKIVLGPGAVQEIELKLVAAPAHAVRGVLLNPDGTPAPNVDIDLAEGPHGPPTFSLETQSDGTFEFPAVVDGEWRIFAEADSGEVDLQATRWIEMTGHELDGLKLRLSPPFTVRVKVEMEIPPGMPAPEPPSVWLVPHHTMDRLNGTDDADGDLIIEGVYPGAYTISGTEPPGYYLDTSNREMAFTAPASITVVYKADGGTVRGSVEKCASGTVWLVPQGAEGSLLRGRCDSNNRYEISAVRPGEYYALTFSGDNPMPWHALVLADSVLKQADRVTVGPGETSSADLRAITEYPQ